MTKICEKNSCSAPGRAFSMVQAGFWMSFCVSVSFASVYLQGLGYSNGLLGLILALGNIMGIVTAISLADWIDRDEKITAEKLIPFVLALQAASACVLLLTPQACPAVSIAFVAYIGFCTTVNNLNLKLYTDADHAGYRINYGFSRGIGSVAYVLISVLLGLLMERVSFRVLPLLGLILCGLQYLSFLRFSRYASAGGKTEAAGKTEEAPCGQSSSLFVFLKNHPQYCLLLTGVVLLFFGHSIACNFLVNLTRRVGGGTADMGCINAFKGLVEIPVMFLYVRLFKDGKHSLALRITAIAFILKTLAFIMAGNIWQLGAAFLLQAPSYALYMAAVVAYVKERIGFEDSAKAQSLAFTTTTLGGMLASLIGGQLYDRLSVTATLWTAFAIGTAGAVILFLGTRQRRPAGTFRPAYAKIGG